MSQMLKSSGAMGLATLASRILGMVREIVYANFMGDGPVASAFTLAFQIPNLFRRLLGEGALTAAFIPIFKDKEKNAGEIEMWRATNAVISGLVIAASAIIGLAMLGLTVALSAHSFSENTQLILRLLRLMFPYMLLVCLTAIFMGILNARGHFFIPAMGATVLNTVMIASVLWLAPQMGATLDKQIFGVAIGVLIAGVAQAAFQWPNLQREGFRYQWVSPWQNETVRAVVHKMIPGAMGVAAFQLNVLLTSLLAINLDDHIVASFNYAVRLMELPQGIFGISLATYLLTTLSGLAAEKKYPEFRATLRQGIRYLIFINLMATLLLVVLAEPIVRLIFQHGKFDEVSTRRAAIALTCLAPGLIAFSLVNILARAFYALGDVATPMRISLFCLTLNFLLTAFFLLRLQLGVGSLGLANTISSLANMGLLLFALRKKLGRLDLSDAIKPLWPLLLTGLAAGLAAWQTSNLWKAHVGHATLWQRLGDVFLPMTIATVVYFAIAIGLKFPTALEILALGRQKMHRDKKDRSG